MEQTMSGTREAAGAAVRAYDVTEAVDGLHRVSRDATTIGYVLRVGRVHVALHGAVYNTAVEVGQSLDFDDAVERVIRG